MILINIGLSFCLFLCSLMMVIGVLVLFTEGPTFIKVIAFICAEMWAIIMVLIVLDTWRIVQWIG